MPPASSTAWHHRIAVDRVEPYMDPVRYQMTGGRDFIAMLGGRSARLRRPASAGRAALSRHRRAHQSAARHQLHRQQVRDRGVPRRDRAQARDRSGRLSARAAEEHAARRSRWSNGWRRWRTGGASATAARSALPTSTIPASQVAGIAEISLDRGSGQIKVHDFWCTIDCGIAVQPDNVVAQTEEQHRLWPRPGPDRAHLDQERRGRAVATSTTITCRA